MKTKLERQLIRQRINTERAEYTHKREKKFQMLKHLGTYGRYMFHKLMKKGIIKARVEGVPQLKWYQKIARWIRNLFKKH